MTAAQLMTDSLKGNRLFNNKSQQFLVSLAELFPPMSGLILECRLQEQKSASVDLSFRFLKHEGEFHTLLAICDQISMCGAETPSAWTQLRNFILLCLHDPFYWQIDTVWIEFDEETVDGNIPVPGVFFNLTIQEQTAPEIIVDCIEKLNGRQLTVNEQNNLVHVYSRMPAGSFVHFTGLFLSRKDSPLRLTIFVQFALLEDFLSSIGAGPLPVELKAVFLRLSEIGIEHVVLNLNINEEISIAPGIEIKANGRCNWQMILDILVQAGWCCSTVMPMLLEWPGHHPVLSTLGMSEKVSLAPVAGKMNDHVFIRRINHIKLQIADNEKKIAKAYLFEGYGWIK